MAYGQVVNPMPVTGTFWQVTQPVSMTSLPALAAGSALIGKVGIDQTTPGTTNAVQIIGSMPSTPVTGTFWQSTQPVSLTTLPALVAGSAIIGKVGIDQTTPGTTNAVQFTNSTLAVTGTFWQSTQPVSISGNQAVNLAQIAGVTTATGTGVMGTGVQRVVIASDNDALTVKQATAANLNATVVGTGTFVTQSTLAAETTKVIGVVRNSDGAGNLLTSNSTTYTAKFGLDVNMLGTLGTAFSTAGKVDVKAADGDVFVRQATPANLQATVTPIAITKGTQGATGFTTQDLKDSGRVYVNFAGVNPVTGVTTEALITLTPYRDLVAGSTATTFAVTSGKRLRLQQLVVTWRNNTAIAGGVTIRLRMLAGTVLVGSPVHATLNASTSLATIGSGQTAILDLPDGLELSGTMQLGLTQICVGAVVGFDVNLIGFEY